MHFFSYFSVVKIVKRVLDFYLEASIHVALSVLCLVIITENLFKLEIGLQLKYAIFFGAIAIYNFIKYGIESKKYVFIPKGRHKKYFIFSMFCVAIALYNFLFVWEYLWKPSLLLLFAVVLYAFPLFPGNKNLRSHGIVKVLLVAIVWVGVTVLLPLMFMQEVIGRSVWVEMIQRFVFVFILMLPFEIRDLAVDPIELGTIPQRIGSIKTKTIGSFGAIVFFVLTYFKGHINIAEIMSKGFIFLLLGFAMYATRRKQQPYFASLYIESIPIVWFVLYWGLLKIVS